MVALADVDVAENNENPKTGRIEFDASSEILFGGDGIGFVRIQRADSLPVAIRAENRANIKRAAENNSVAETRNGNSGAKTGHIAEDTRAELSGFDYDRPRKIGAVVNVLIAAAFAADVVELPVVPFREKREVLHQRSFPAGFENGVVVVSDFFEAQRKVDSFVVKVKIGMVLTADEFIVILPGTQDGERGYCGENERKGRGKFGKHDAHSKGRMHGETRESRKKYDGGQCVADAGVRRTTSEDEEKEEGGEQAKGRRDFPFGRETAR